jgi:hypothetical protein
MIHARLKRSLLLLLPICLVLLTLFFWMGYISSSLFMNALLILLSVVLMGITVRLILERDRRLHDQGNKRRSSFMKK